MFHQANFKSHLPHNFLFNFVASLTPADKIYADICYIIKVVFYYYSLSLHTAAQKCPSSVL